MKLAQIYRLALTQLLVFLLAVSPLASLAREYTQEEQRGVPQKFLSYFSRSDEKMNALEIIYMNNNCAQNNTNTCQMTRTAIEDYASSNRFPVLRDIPGAEETLLREPSFHPNVRQNYVNNLKNEITEANIAITQYQAEMKASYDCRKELECEAQYKKAAENLAKATNRKANAVELLNDYRKIGLLATEEEPVAQGTANASEEGTAKASDFINKTNDQAVTDTTNRSLDTFSATGTGKSHEGLDPDKMDVTATSGFAGQIVMSAIGTVGRGILLCTNAMTQAEVIAYAAGAAMYIVGEIQGFQDFKKAQKDLKDALEVIKKDKGAQKEALYKMLQAYQTMRQTSEKKMNMQTAAATAFFGAAAIAATKYGLSVASRTACVAACATAQAAACASCPYCPLCAPCSAASSAASSRAGFLMSNDVMACVSATKYASTLAKETGFMTIISMCPGCASCQQSFGVEQKSWVMCPSAPSAASHNSFDNWTQFVASAYDKKTPSKAKVHKDTHINVIAENDPEGFAQKFIDLIIPKAKAFGGPLMGLGGVALSMLSALVFTEWGVFDLWMHGPLGRAIVFGLTGAFAVMQVKATQGVITEIDKRIALVQQILARMEAEEIQNALSHNIAGIPGMTGYPNTSTLTAIRAQIPTIAEPFPQAIPCLTTEGEKVKGTKCASLHAIMSKTNFDSKKITSDSVTSGSISSKMTNFSDSSFNSAMYSAASIADSLQGSDKLSNATMDQAAELGGKLSISQKALKEAEDMINKNITQTGKKGINFEAYRTIAESSLQKAVLKEAKKNKMTLQQASEQFGNGTALASLDQNKLSSGSTQDGKSAAPSATDAASALASFNLDYQSPKLNVDSASGTQATLDTNADALAKAAKESEELKLNSAYSKDAQEKEQIIDKPEYNIFKIISVRYLKTGYKRLGFGVTTKPVETKPTTKKQ